MAIHIDHSWVLKTLENQLEAVCTAIGIGYVGPFSVNPAPTAASWARGLNLACDGMARTSVADMPSVAFTYEVGVRTQITSGNSGWLAANLASQIARGFQGFAVSENDTVPKSQHTLKAHAVRHEVALSGMDQASAEPTQNAVVTVTGVVDRESKENFIATS